jgi:hypothetical protein
MRFVVGSVSLGAGFLRIFFLSSVNSHSTDNFTFINHRHIASLNNEINKKFGEELIIYFRFIRHGPH